MRDGRYLKIGELARLKGVSVKSLRYYDRIGVLKPAHVDPDTGYRYYAPEQLILLDLIRLSLTFQLPLKELAHSGDAPDLKRLILEGEAQARAKLEEARRTLRLSQDVLAQLERLDRPHPEGRSYAAPFPARQLLLSPWTLGRDDARAYMTKLAQLHQQARSLELTLLTQQGLLLDLEQNTASVFLAVEGDAPQLLTLPAGAYQCRILPERELSRIPALLAEQGLSPRFVLCLNTDIYDYCLEHPLHQLEVQVLQ